MTFQETFEKSISVKPSLTPEFLPEAFVGSFYELSEETTDRLPTVLCGGTIEFPSIYKLTCDPMDCHMLLYTRTGSGNLLWGKKNHSLTEGTFLYTDCSAASFTLDAAQSPWQISIFLVRGTLLATLDSLVPFGGLLLHTIVSTHSPVLSGMERLLSGSTDANLRNKLTDASLLQGMITDLFIDAWKLEAPADKCAPYLSEIRQYLNTHFADPLRLDDLEKRYHISKYRICHEFSKAFGSPPVRYLNLRRLEVATHLLLTTDRRIHEISLDVGFENTNHFINLFKREMGTTPQAYRDAHRG
ncbi:MAG: helix-turn-helix transcriptional regulator [Lachnospiraceae bacterium]|nr:helix-turn-helix transcriptional regulator [Lachnospiraceae bacterium]